MRELRRRAASENLEERHVVRRGRHSLAIEHSQVAEDGAVQVEERNPHVAHGPEPFQIPFEREQIDDPIRIVNEPLAVDHDLTGCAVDGVLVILDPIAAQPESERAQAACLREVLRHPRAVGPQGASQVLDEGHEEALAGLAGRPLENHPQRGVPVAMVRDRPFAAICLSLGALGPLHIGSTIDLSRGCVSLSGNGAATLDRETRPR